MLIITAWFTTAGAGVYPVTTTGDTGPGSLRQAITDANASAGSDTITFNIPGAGPHTIQPASSLPTITDPLVIDGYTQPGAQANSVAAPGITNAILKIELNGSSAGINVAGLHITSNACLIRGMAINRFDGPGIWINGVSAQYNVVEGNYIGTDISGSTALANTDHGILINAALNNTIGGTPPWTRNLVSGNDFCGIEIRGQDGPATGNRILGNFIGTTSTGSGDLGNGEDGILIDNASNNTIGGTTASARNVISGNDDDGIEIDGQTGPANSNLVLGNFIGTDVNGTAAVGNEDNGVFIVSGAHNTIGGATAGERNILSGNGDHGVYIVASPSIGNLVEGNYIGTDVTGTLDLGNGWDAVRFDYYTGSNTVRGNLCSGNDHWGITIIRDSNGIIVIGNKIGTDVTGTAAIPNMFHGVYIYQADSSRIGGTGAGEGNIIAYNGGDGITVETGVDNSFLCNSIVSNDSLGIDLDNDDVTPNDAGDPDGGSNDLQNYPVLTAVCIDAYATTIQGSLNSTPDSTFALQFFHSQAVDPSGYGEGGTFFADTVITVDGSGDASFSFTLQGALIPEGSYVTATATGPTGSTSEFSQAVLPAALSLSGEIVGSFLELQWTSIAPAGEYWLYGAANETYFEPGLDSPFDHRLAAISSSITAWSSSSGVGDPANNWTYLVVAVDDMGRYLCRSNRFGEHDFMAP